MFLWFVAVIRRRVGDLEDRFFATVFFGSAIVWVVVWLAGVASVAAVPLAQQMGGTWELTADAVRVSQGLAAAWLLLIGPRIQAVFVVSTSTVFLRTSVLPKWIAYLGYALGLTLFVVPAAWRDIPFVFPLWVLVVSITILIVRGRRVGKNNHPTNQMIATEEPDQ
jgi:hypothetical protein